MSSPRDARAAELNPDDEDAADETTCKICYDEQVRVQHRFPCTHWTCEPCAARLYACPFCRYPVRGEGSGRRADLHDLQLCLVCGRTFDNMGALDQHRRDTGHDRVCWCGRQCASPEALLMHQRDTGHLDHPQVLVLERESDLESDPFGLADDFIDFFELRQAMAIAELRRDTGELGWVEEYSCDVCDRGFRSRQALSHHMRDTGHFVAERAFGSPLALAQHRRDTGQANFRGNVCDFCGESFRTLYSLLMHQFETNHDCICTCGRQFASPDALQMHQRATGHFALPSDVFSAHSPSQDLDDPWESTPARLQTRARQSITATDYLRGFGVTCDICGRDFWSAHALAQHRRDTGHGIEVPLAQHWHPSGFRENADIECDTCGRAFTNRQALVRHQRATGHLQRIAVDPFECWCGRGFASHEALRMHQRAVGHDR